VGILRDIDTGNVEVNEPTNTPPVPARATVSCVHCSRVVPLAETDVVGLGYRCRACTDRAEIGELVGRPDVADHLDIADRARFAESARRYGIRALVTAAAMVVIACILLAVSPADPGRGMTNLVMKLLWGAILVLVIGGSFALDRWRRFRVR
jgi:hypothetical protein